MASTATTTAIATAIVKVRGGRELSMELLVHSREHVTYRHHVRIAYHHTTPTTTPGVRHSGG